MGEATTNYWGRVVQKVVAYIFLFHGNIIIYQLYKLALTDPAKVTL